MIKEIINALAGRQTKKEAPKEKAPFTHRINKSPLWRIKAEMDTYRAALEQARNPLRYDRRALYAIYREVELDDQVIAQLRIARSVVQRAPFEILGSSNQAADMFRRPWFNDLLGLLTTTEFWGHSLIEFNTERNSKGEFTSFNLIPHDHVRPEYGEVAINLTDYSGIKYRTGEFPMLLEIGNPYDIGLHHVIAIPAIRKRYADTDWSLFAERFGSPFLTIKTASRKKEELDAKEAMARNFGSNGYAILDDQDEINAMFMNSNGSGHRTFSERMDKADNQIAKLINGQTGASDEKAWVGSAQVHERILNDFTFARLTRIQYWINEQLIPFLIANKYPLKGGKFEFTELRGVGKNPNNPEKKKQQLNLQKIISHYNQCNCQQCQE